MVCALLLCTCLRFGCWESVFPLAHQTRDDFLGKLHFKLQQIPIEVSSHYACPLWEGGRPDVCSVPVSPVASLTVCGLSLFSLPLSQMRKADIYAYGSPATYPLKPRRLVVYIVQHRHHFCQYFPTMYIVGCYRRELHNSYRHHAVLETHNQHACVVSLAICQTVNKVHT